jgi:hypothetical protein
MIITGRHNARTIARRSDAQMVPHTFGTQLITRIYRAGTLVSDARQRNTTSTAVLQRPVRQPPRRRVSVRKGALFLDKYKVHPATGWKRGSARCQWDWHAGRRDGLKLRVFWSNARYV